MYPRYPGLIGFVSAAMAGGPGESERVQRGEAQGVTDPGGSWEMRASYGLHGGFNLHPPSKNAENSLSKKLPRRLRRRKETDREARGWRREKEIGEESERVAQGRRVDERCRRKRGCGIERGFTTAEMKLSVHGLPSTSLYPRISLSPPPAGLPLSPGSACPFFYLSIGRRIIYTPLLKRRLSIF